MGLQALVLCAGYGSRFLPITRVVPKELLPLVDRPALDFVIEELTEAGVERVVIVTARRKPAIAQWFQHDTELEQVFAREKAAAKLARARPPEVDVAFVVQEGMLGAGHAILQARGLIGDDPFVLAYPDDLFGAPNCTSQLVQAWRDTGCSAMAAHDLPGQDLSRYGVFDVEGSGPRRKVRSIVEKPPGTPPSTLVSLGRYLYAGDFMERLAEGFARHDPASGEYFPTAAINAQARAGGVVAQVVDAPRYDTGQPLGYLQAITDFALARGDVGPAWREWLAERLRRQ